MQPPPSRKEKGHNLPNRARAELEHMVVRGNTKSATMSREIVTHARENLPILPWKTYSLNITMTRRDRKGRIWLTYMKVGRRTIMGLGEAY